MVSRSNGLLYSVGQGYSAVDAQAWRDKLDGFAVASGLTPSVGASGLEVDVASGTATVGESSGVVDTVTLGSTTTITLDAADGTNPRKDVVYIDTSGTLQKETGTAGAANPSGNTRFNTFEPEPPFPSTAGAILAEVWVAAGATSLQSADVRDRRMPADAVGDRAVYRTGFVDDLAGGWDVRADSWQDIQDAVSDLGSGTVVRLRNDVTYDPDATVQPPADFWILGPPHGLSAGGLATIQPSGDTQPFDFNSPRSGMAHVFLDGVNTTSADGFWINQGNQRYRNVWVESFGGDNINHMGGPNPRTWGVVSRSAGGACFKITGSGTGNAATGRHLGMELNAGSPNLEFDEDTTVTGSENDHWFFGLTSQGASTRGLDVVEGSGLWVFGSHWENNTTEDVRFQSGANECTVWSDSGGVSNTNNGAGCMIRSTNKIISGGMAKAGIGGTFDLRNTTGDFDGQMLRHDGSGTISANVLCRWDSGNSVWILLEPSPGNYTGDGTQNRQLVDTNFKLRQVIIQESGGNATMVFLGGSKIGLSGTAFAGEMAISGTGGFQVGDNGADADPNTNGEAYEPIFF